VNRADQKIAQKSRNSCIARGGEVGAEGMVEKEKNVMQQIKTLKIILFVTSIALTSATL